MNHALTIFAITGISALALLSSYPARSGDEQINAVATLPGKAVAIIEDQEAKAFRFMIDGQEVARIDTSGLHVREGLSYGGSLTDYGPLGYDMQNGQQGAKAE